MRLVLLRVRVGGSRGRVGVGGKVQVRWNLAKSGVSATDCPLSPLLCAWR